MPFELIKTFFPQKILLTKKTQTPTEIYKKMIQCNNLTINEHQTEILKNFDSLSHKYGKYIESYNKMTPFFNNKIDVPKGVYLYGPSGRKIIIKMAPLLYIFV